MSTNYDCIVIGAGQAGTPLAKKLAQAGKKTALIEKRYIGGTCVNDGCTPTKAMVASARAAYLAGRCNDLGVHIDGYHIDMPRIKQRKDEIVLRFRNGSLEGLQKTKNLEVIFGEATFTGPKSISINLNDGGIQELTADQYFLNTGATAIIPEIEGIHDIDYLTNTTILELNSVPSHLLIIGGNYIGLEFGQMFRRLGADVTIIERSERLMPREDEDVADCIKNIIEEDGVKVFTNAIVQKFAKDNSGQIAATVSAGGISQQITCSHILVATGRRPVTENLGLNKAGVEVDDKGHIKTNDHLETTARGIYALGDVRGGPAFTHISYNDYTIVYRNLFEGTDYDINDRPVPYCMFTDPQLGRIGLSEQEARKQGLNIKIAKIPMAHVARGIETGETRGLMKAVVDIHTKQILGAAIIGEQGGEIMTVLQMAMMGGITYDRIRYCVFAHPLYAESLNNLFMSVKD